MDGEEVRIAFEAAVIQIATIPTKTRAAAKALITNDAVVAPIARFVTNQTRTKVSGLLSSLLWLVLRQRLLLLLDRLYLTLCGERRGPKSHRGNDRRKLLFLQTCRAREPGQDSIWPGASMNHQAPAVKMSSQSQI